MPHSNGQVCNGYIVAMLLAFPRMILPELVCPGEVLLQQLKPERQNQAQALPWMSMLGSKASKYFSLDVRSSGPL